MNAIKDAVFTNSFLGKKTSKKGRVIKLGKGKVKKEKKISFEQDILNILRSSGLDASTYTSVLGILRSKGKTLQDPENAEFFAKIANLEYNVSKISVPDILGGKKLNSILQIGNITLNEKNCFTNDKLYWISYITKMYDKFEEIKSFIDLSNMNVSIATLATKNDKDYNFGYIQDFNKYFSFIGSNLLTKEGANQLIEESIKKTDTVTIASGRTSDTYAREIKFARNNFTYNNEEYIMYIGNNDLILVYSTKIADKVKEIYNQIKMFSSLDIKKAKDAIDVKKAEATRGIFIAQNIKLSDFSPNIVYTTNNLKTTVLVEYEIDLNSYFDNALALIKKYGEESNTKTIGDLFTGIELNIKDLDVLHVFLFVLYITKLKGGGSRYELRIKTFLENYSKLKDKVVECLSTLNVVFNTIEKFYDCFKTKVNFDPVKNLHKYVTDNKISVENFFSTFDFSDLRTNLADYGLDKVFVSFESALKNRNFLLRLYQKIYNVGDMFNSLREPSSIVKEIRETGIACYRVFYDKYNTDSLNIIWKIKSPASFLGNLYGDDTGYDITISRAIGRAEERYVAKAVDDERQIKNLIALTNIDEISDGIITESLANMLVNVIKKDEKYLVMVGNKITELFKDWAAEKIKKREINDEVLKYIYLYYKALKDEITVDKDNIQSMIFKNITNYINEFKSYVETNKSKYAVAMAELKDEYGKLSEKIEDLKKKEEEAAPFEDERSVIDFGSLKVSKKEDLLKLIANQIKGVISLENQAKLGLAIIDSTEFGKLPKNTRELITKMRNAGLLDKSIYDKTIKVGKTQYKNITKEIINDIYNDTLTIYSELLEKAKKDTATKTILDNRTGIAVSA